MQVIEIGVRDFLLAAFRAGGIEAGFSPRSRWAQGTAAHTEIAARRPEGYVREAPIRYQFDWEGFRLVVRGRIDGLHDKDGFLILEELKSTSRALEAINPQDAPMHLAQLQLYHHFLQRKCPGARIIPTLTYMHPETLEERSFAQNWTPEESRQFFEELAISFLTRERERRGWRAVRNASLRKLPFPFAQERPGQAELIVGVERHITGHRDLLAEAATGIGKTMAVLYPAVKLLAKRKGYSRIFYLTAKSSGAEAARGATLLLRGQGARLRVLYLRAKERCCPLAGPEKPECDGRECPYADGFFERADPVVRELATHEEITPELIAAAGERETLCPFELALEVSLLADIIVCDYNYVFDPGVALRRFFAPGLPNDNLFLIDEAHNLVARGREIYSAPLEEGWLTAIRDLCGNDGGGIAPHIQRLRAAFDNWRHSVEMEGGELLRLPELPAPVTSAVNALLDELGEILMVMQRGERRAALLELFFELNRFSRIAEDMTPDFQVFVQWERHTATLRLFCPDPGPLLRRRIERGVSAICLSATLTPARYFARLLGVREGYGAISTPSPFPRENRLFLHVPDVSTRFIAREATRPTVARVIMDVARARAGNYLAFFPSYAYLGTVWAEMIISRPTDLEIITQKPQLSPQQQLAFIEEFSKPSPEGQSRLGLAVMGGVFGEAVDLPGEKLVGVIIVGPGLPAVSLEQELIREHFDDPEGEGFHFAYIVPGMIRVIQAAGRVFRTPRDRGVVVCMDDRFLEDAYRELLPADWAASDADFSILEYQEMLKFFWVADEKLTYSPHQ